MSVIDRTSLEASPLADLHAIASELSIDGYRRLRRPGLINAILAKQSGDDSHGQVELDSDQPDAAVSEQPDVAASERPDGAVSERADVEVSDGADAQPSEVESASEPGGARDSDEEEERTGPRRRRGRRGGRGRSAAREDDGADADTARDETPAETTPAEATPAEKTGQDERLDAKPRGRKSATGDEGPEREHAEEEEVEEQVVEGVVELLANGSGFVRVDPPDPSDGDVYISSAQVKRCELVSGDRIAGPKRLPRRSERFASLIRIDTINGRPASELADGVRFDDLPAAYPDQRIKIGSEDPTLNAIEWLTPFGKGSRVTIVGPSRSGKTEALQRLAAALAGREDLVLSVALAGVRPEEISAWTQGPVAPVSAVSFAASEEAQGGVIEPVIDQARRLAARGADVVVLIDTLDGCSPAITRKTLASARNIADGGSVTVIATAREPLGGETTVIALDLALASVGRFPALDIIASGIVRPELLVGKAAAEAIARTRAEASEVDDED